MTDFRIILSTCADREQAERIAHRRLELAVRLHRQPIAPGKTTLSFAIPSEAEGSAVLPTSNQSIGKNKFTSTTMKRPRESPVSSLARVGSADGRLIKTRAGLSGQVQAAVAALHSYQVPELLEMAVAGGSEPCLAWLGAGLR